MTDNFIAANYEIRLASTIRPYRSSEPPKLHQYWPWGLTFSHVEKYQRHEIQLNGPDGILLDIDGRDGEWTYVTDMSGQALHKFLSVTEPSLIYQKEEFWSMGQPYILEIRIVQILE